jgi:uncharacterized RDD family membrane protein YckC
MATDEPSFSWGSETFERRPRRLLRARRSRSDRPIRMVSARANALIIDGFVLLIPVLAIAWLASLLFPGDGFFFYDSAGAGSARLTIGIPGSLLISAVSLSYFFIYEARTGQTIGKRRMGICVRAANGGPAGLRAISARTVLRLIDGIAFYLLGLLVALISGKRRRRIGDLAGGTVVVAVDPAFEPAPAQPLWRLLAFPASWILGLFVLVFATPIATAESEGARAISLVRSYEAAREAGNGALACSMLTVAQQRELVAIQSGSYARASAAACPQYILREVSNSHLMNPELAELARGPLTSAYSTLGAVLVHAPGTPSVVLSAVHEGGALKLDVRGLQRLEFIAGYTASAHGHRAVCACVFDTARAEGRLPEGTAAEAALLRPAVLKCRGIELAPAG